MVNRRKIFLLLTAVLIACMAFALYYNFKDPNIHSKSAILMDASSGETLYEKDATTSYPIASMSKMMTEYIVLEHIASGAIHWEDQVVMSETANNLGDAAVSIPIDVGESLSVKDLFAAMVISSANNATIALAEYIAHTEDNFTILMNEKAVDMNLSNQTQFVNATGLPNERMDHQENQMSAKDVATLAYHLLMDYHEVVDWTSQLVYHVDSNDINLYSTNQMLNDLDDQTYVEGVDGLKTGFTDGAGYCFTGTAMQGNKRLISVIMDAENDEARFIETKKLFSFGFGKMHIPSFKAFIKSVLGRA